MRITINGIPGSGKGTAAKYISKRFKLKYYGMGDIRREAAKEKGMTINELNKLGEKEAWTDLQVDNFQKKLKNKDNFIADGRLSWHFIPNSIKIFLTVKPEIGAKRILKARRLTEKYKTLKEAVRELKKRVKSDIKRYRKLYGISNMYSLKNYDIIIDTSYLTKEQMNKLALESVLKFSGMK